LEVSIVVPIYNVEKYLDKCIDSIVNQTYGDFELILVDDGSTDDSGRIADSWAKKDIRIRNFHTEHKGVAAARNHGIRRATGAYICFVDSDDWLELTYLEELHGLAQSNKADLVICDFIRNSGDIVASQPDTEELVIEDGYEAISNIYSSNYIKYVVVWHRIYKREIFANIEFAEGMIHEDEAISAFIFCAASRIVRTNRVLYNYRTNNVSSIMTRQYNLNRLDILKALEMRMDLFADKGYKVYYENDSFKYMYKILLNLIEIKKLNSDNMDLIKSLKRKYWDKYRESREFSWTKKRRIAMAVFGIFPELYLLRYKAN